MRKNTCSRLNLPNISHLLQKITGQAVVILIGQRRYCMEKGNPMRLKNLCALFLLLIGSVYFICPVQCAAVGEVDGHAASDTTSLYQLHLTAPQSADEATGSTCCSREDQPAPTHDSREEREQHCCFNRWEALGDSEPQSTSQIQNGTYSSVLLVPTTPKISSSSVFLTALLQLSLNPYTNPPPPSCSPRAPPFFLA